MRLGVILLTLLLLFLVIQSASAAASASYHLDWFNPLTSAGGGPSNSAHFSANVTIGQTVSRSSASPAYQASFGFWTGILNNLRVMLPLILRQ
jgi:hypothetical protein